MPSGMNLVMLVEKFGSEDRCREYLEKLRWPDGPACPRCESDKISRIYERDQFDCDSCNYQFSVTAGTISGLNTPSRNSHWVWLDPGPRPWPLFGKKRLS